MEQTWTSIARWLLHAGLGGSLLLVVTLLAMRYVRQPARRQRLGEIGLAAALLVAAICWRPAWLPLWACAPLPQQNIEWMLVPVEDGQAPEEMPVMIEQPRLAAPWAATSAPASGIGTDWLPPVLVSAYGLGAALCLLRWFTGVVALWRIVRAARPATPELLAAFRQRFVGRRSPRLLISTRLRVPVSCGIWKPTVILPESLSVPTQAAERDWVFAHELTHLARRDSWSALLFAVGQMVYFALPWFWWLKRQVRLCQEYVADAAAAAQHPADEYAEFLLSLTASPAVPLAATGVSGTTSDLYRRVTMLLKNPLRVELSCPRAWTIGAAGVLVGLAVVAAGVGPAQADPPSQKEILEQLNRIQDMVNQLRSQVAEQPKADTKKDDVPGRIRVNVNVEDPKKAAEAAVQKGVRYLQRAVEKEVEKNRAQAELERARAMLDRLIAQEHAKAADAQRAAAQKPDAPALQKAQTDYRVLVEKQRELSRQLAAAAQRDSDKELKVILDLLAKHQETLKDSDAVTRKALQDAMDRLKEALKKLPDGQWRQWQSIPALAPIPAIPSTPAAPKAPAKAGAIVQLAPRAPLEFSSDGYEKALRTWVQRAPSQGRLGIRVEPPAALLAEQLNLPKDQGMVVAEVFDNSVAKKAGIKVNDILLKVNQQAVSSNAEAFVKLVADIKADTPFDIVVLRRGKQETIQNVRLAEASPPQGYRTAVRLRQFAGAKDPQIMITVSRKDNKITLNRNEGELMITVEAEAADGKNKVTGIAIVEKGKTSKYGNVEEVPEPNRAKVQHLLQLLDSAGGAQNFQYRFVPRTRGFDSDQDVLKLLLPQDKALEIKPLLPRQIPLPGSDESKDLYYRVPNGKSAAPSLNINVLPDLKLEGELELSGNVADLLKLHNALPKELLQKKTAPDRP
jgi:beta-lactamase regulating signal transducer with metallopeptidase domain